MTVPTGISASAAAVYGTVSVFSTIHHSEPGEVLASKARSTVPSLATVARQSLGSRSGSTAPA